MSNVVRLRDGLINPETCWHTQELDDTIASAIDLAKAQGVPQGLIVAVLQGHAHCETAEMVGDQK